MIYVDKSAFSPAELVQYEALIAKASVEYEDQEEEIQEDVTPTIPPKKTQKKKPCATKKEAPTAPVISKKDQEEPAQEPPEGEEDQKMKTQKSAAAPEIAEALARLETLEKSIEMKGFSEIAKKYAPLGEDEGALAKTLYDLSKSSEENYKAYISVLDKSLDLVNKSGLFSEIGKSASAYSSYSGGSVVDQIDAKAADIMKADPSMDKYTAVAKAWEDNPDLVIAYENERNGR